MSPAEINSPITNIILKGDAVDPIGVLHRQLRDREDALALEQKSVARLAQEKEALQRLVLDFEQWALSIAPHSYRDSDKTASIRERVDAMKHPHKEAFL